MTRGETDWRRRSAIKGEVETERGDGEYAGQTGGEGGRRGAESGPQLRTWGRNHQGWSDHQATKSQMYEGGVSAMLLAIFHKKKTGEPPTAGGLGTL